MTDAEQRLVNKLAQVLWETKRRRRHDWCDLQSKREFIDHLVDYGVDGPLRPLEVTELHTIARKVGVAE